MSSTGARSYASGPVTQAAPLALGTGYTLYVNGLVGGEGNITSDPAGIDCGNVGWTCSATFPEGTVVTLTFSHPAGGNEFVAWEGACTGAGICQVTMSATQSVGAIVRAKEAPVAGLIGATPNLRTMTGFQSTTDDTFRCRTRPCLEPPDSWVAVGPAHVVHATNDGIRVTDRNGAPLADYFLWDFFSEQPDEIITADPRVIYDPSTGRWMATAMSADCDAGTVYLAVSATTDPMGAWTVYANVRYGELLDYPGLGRSGDKVAVAVDLFTLAGCIIDRNEGSRVTVVDRSTLLAGGSLPSVDFVLGSTVDAPTTWRPSVSVGAGTDIWLIGRPFSDDLQAARIVGSVASGTAAVVQPGSSTPWWDNLSWSQNASRLLDGDMFIDGRPTDAVSYDAGVWFVATNLCRPAPDVETSCVRVTKVGPTGVEQDFAIGSTVGPTFGGGIGLSRNGTLFITYNQLTTGTNVISTFATYRLPSDPPGQRHPSALLTNGTTPYRGSRWGDYSSVAFDPTDPASVWHAAQYPEAGGWTTRVSRLAVATGPAAGTVAINGGAATTTSPVVNLTLSAAAGSNATEALVSNSGMMNGTILAKYVRTPLGVVKNWSLTATASGGTNATGTRTIYVQFGRGNGGWSAPVPASIGFQSVKISRAAGADRYATAAAVSASTYAPGVEVAYVSTGTGFPEPLAAAPLAGWLRGPLLLTPATSLAAATATELQRLKPRYVVIVGSTSVISDAVKNSIAKYTLSGYVLRDAGADRYETAAIAALNTFEPGVPALYVAYGLNWPDALAAGAAGGYKGGPVLLTPTASLPYATTYAIKQLKPQRIYVVGSSAVVSNAVFNTLNSMAPTTRLAGADRYATAVAISKATFATGVDVAYIAYGLNFPDALSGAAAAGFRGGPVLLTPTATLNALTAAELVRLKPKRIVVLGSAAVVSASVYTKLAAYATGP